MVFDVFSSFSSILHMGFCFLCGLEFCFRVSFVFASMPGPAAFENQFACIFQMIL